MSETTAPLRFHGFDWLFRRARATRAWKKEAYRLLKRGRRSMHEMRPQGSPDHSAQLDGICDGMGEVSG